MPATHPPAIPGERRADTTRSLLSNAGIMGVAQVIYLACQWGILIALARLGGPEMVGRFALALAITAPVMLFSNLALRPALVTDVQGEHPLGRYLALRLVTTAFATATIGLTLLVIGYERSTALLILAIALAKAFENLSDILYGIAQRYERFDLVAKSMSARAILGLLSMVAGIWLTGDVVYGALALALAWALVLALHDWPMTAPWRRAGGHAGPPRDCFALAWSVFPLGVAALLISLNGNLPRYVIAERFGEAELGVFAAMAYLAVAGGMLINVLGQVASPRLARAGADQDPATYTKILAVIVAVSLALGGTGVVLAEFFGDNILTLLYGEDFLTRPDLLVWVMGAAVVSFAGSCFGFATTALRIFRLAPMVHAVVLAINVVACAVLTDHGVHGVIIAWVISLLANLTFYGCLIIRHWRSVVRQEGEKADPLVAMEQAAR